MTREELGSVIAELRENRGVSIRDLAKRCELSPSTIVNIEQGKFSPRFEIVALIVEELGGKITIKFI